MLHSGLQRWPRKILSSIDSFAPPLSAVSYKVCLKDGTVVKEVEGEEFEVRKGAFCFSQRRGVPAAFLRV